MILEIGSINHDYIIHCKQFPRPKESILADQIETMLGGKGANQIAAAGRLGADAVLIGMLGQDDSANQMILNDLEWAHVRTECLETVPDSKTGSAYVIIDQSGQNEIIIHAAANAAMTPSIVDKYRSQFEKATICITEFALPMETCKYAMKVAKEYGATTIVNPAPYAEIPEDFYPYIDILTPNEMESAQFCGFAVSDPTSAAAACQWFHQKGVKNVVITMGHLGAFVSNGEKSLMIDSYHVNAIDTSGAGDSFNGGLAYAYERGHDIFVSSRFGNAVASLCVQRRGTARSMPTFAEVEKVLKL